LSGGSNARRLLVALLAIWVACVPRRAQAHDPFEITTLALSHANALELRVTMTKSAATRYLASVSNATAHAVQDAGAPIDVALSPSAGSLFTLSSAGVTMTPTRYRVTINAESEVEIHLEYPAPQPGALRLEAKHLSVLPEGYVNSVVVKTSRPERVLTQRFLHSGDTAFDTALPAAATVDERASSAAPLEPWPQRLRRFVALGVHHVLTGYDHLLFLAAILIPCVRVRSLIALVTCFTLAHSVSLLGATLAGWAAPSSVVEPLIAASIVFVGIENLLAKGEPRSRYGVTFGFGLVHGLGFAAALRDTLADSVPALPLVSFNLGVELAQLALAAVFLPLLLALRRRAPGVSVTRALSGVVTVAGLYWVVERTLLA